MPARAGRCHADLDDRRARPLIECLRRGRPERHVCAPDPAVEKFPVGKSPAGHETACQAPRMITEHAVLEVLPERTDAFEAAFVQAKDIISAMSGFRSLQLARCIEVPSRYLLLVEWDTLEDHTEGFRKSPEYEEWKALLHGYYDPFPTVDHYEVVLNG